MVPEYKRTWCVEIVRPGPTILVSQQITVWASLEIILLLPPSTMWSIWAWGIKDKQIAKSLVKDRSNSVAGDGEGTSSLANVPNSNIAIGRACNKSSSIKSQVSHGTLPINKSSEVINYYRSRGVHCVANCAIAHQSLCPKPWHYCQLHRRQYIFH